MKSNNNQIKVGLLYATNDAYAMATCVSLCSVLENNKNAIFDYQVKIIAYIYCDNWSSNSLQNLRNITDRYECELHIMNPQWCYKQLEASIESDTYAGTFAAEVRLFAPYEIDVDYNIICLDSDVAMISGNNLFELATYDLKKHNACCASTIDMQNSRMIKKIANMGVHDHIYNIDGIFLVNPKLYKEYNIENLLKTESKRVAYVLNPYWMMVRNGYVLRNVIVPLPMKYQIYPPMNRLIREKDWMFIFGLSYNEYYSKNEINEATANPVFVHYINWIVKKPWLSYPYIKEKIPFFDEWDKYQNLTNYKKIKKLDYQISITERIRYFMFHYFYHVYIFICGLVYRLEVKKRNSIVKQRAREKGVKL